VQALSWIAQGYHCLRCTFFKALYLRLPINFYCFWTTVRFAVKKSRRSYLQFSSSTEPRSLCRAANWHSILAIRMLIVAYAPIEQIQFGNFPLLCRWAKCINSAFSSTAPTNRACVLLRVSPVTTFSWWVFTILFGIPKNLIPEISFLLLLNFWDFNNCFNVDFSTFRRLSTVASCWVEMKTFAVLKFFDWQNLKERIFQVLTSALPTRELFSSNALILISLMIFFT